MKVFNELNETRHTIGIVRHFNKELSHFKELMQPVSYASKDMVEDYLAYFKSFGFKHVNPEYMKTIVAINKQYDKRYIPDDFFNVYLDNPYPNIADHWKNKAYQDEIMSFIRYPETIARNVNGYYIDKDGNIISEDRVLDIIKNEDRLVIKPSLVSGGGINVNFFDGSDVDRDILRGYSSDFIIQRKMKQSALMESLHPGCTNTIKISSFLFNGEVYITGAFLRLSFSEREKDNLYYCDDWCIVGVKIDGSLNEEGYCPAKLGRTRDCTFSGVKFKDIKLDFYSDCVEIIKKAHKRLLYFPFVSWDFAQAPDGSPVLIEYNMKWHIVLEYQLDFGPLLGDITNDVLKATAEKNRIKYFC